MGKAGLQRDVRSAISITYELLRHEQVLKQARTASTLRDLESELARIEAKLGGPRRGEIVAESLDPWMRRVERAANSADPVVAGQIRALVESLRDIQRDLARVARRARGGFARHAPAIVIGLGGAALAAAPFALGYAKKDPEAARRHLGIGLAAVGLALVSALRRG